MSAPVRGIYAADAPVPPGAQVPLQGENAQVSWLRKYCSVDAQGEQM